MPPTHRLVRRIVNRSILPGDAVKRLHAMRPARQPRPKKIRCEISVELHERRRFWFHEVIRLMSLGVDLLDQLRTLAGSQKNLDTRILLQSANNGRDGRIVHRGTAINKNATLLS